MLKKYLSAGLLFWIPLATTLWILNWMVRMTDGLVSLLPAAYQPEAIFGKPIPGFGLILTLLLVLFTGFLVANFIGKKLYKLWESFLGRIPVVRSIYSSVKQVCDTLLSEQAKSFKQVVLVQFPQEGNWTLGLLAGDAGPSIDGYIKGVNEVVFVPTGPNPTSGYVIVVDKKNLIYTDISVDQAFKYHVSLGVIRPDSHPNLKK